MSSEWIIGALAFITIGGTLALGIFHFCFQLKSPANMEVAKRVAADRKSATTSVIRPACVDAPWEARSFLNRGGGDRQRSCVRPQGAACHAAGRYGDARAGSTTKVRARSSLQAPGLPARISDHLPIRFVALLTFPTAGG